MKVTNLGVGYPQADGSVKKVVDDVSFHVDRGEILGIVGESGSGKSQTAFSILGLLPDNARIVAGSIQFDGNYTVAPGEEHVSQDRLSKLRGRRISYIPQEPMSNLDPAFTIGYQLVTPMVRVLGSPRARHGAGAKAPDGRRNRQPEADLRRLPARSLRRHGPAHAHRRRASAANRTW